MADEPTGPRSAHSAVPTEIRFVNRSGQTVRVFWLDFDGRRQFYQTLWDWEAYDQPTYLTHPWLVTDEGGAAWDVHLPTEQPRTVVITTPPKT